MARKMFHVTNSLNVALQSSWRTILSSNTRALPTIGVLVRSKTNYIPIPDVEKWNGEEFVRESRHQETPIYPELHSGKPPPMGKIYDKKPFKMEIEAGKLYKWCSCGLSRTQPFCDETHFIEEGTSFTKRKPRFRPVRYKSTESKTVYWCNCKQTKNRPFCDNSHRKPEIEEANSIYRN